MATPVINAVDHGLSPEDSKGHQNFDALNRAIDAADANSGWTIIIPKGIYELEVAPVHLTLCAGTVCSDSAPRVEESAFEDPNANACDTEVPDA